MGTINYKTMEYITMAIKTYDFDEAKEALKEEFENPETISDNAIYDEISFWYEADEENARAIIDKYYFMYFKLDIIPGYYDGIQLDFETDFYFDFEDEKKDCLQELVDLKQCLVDLAGVGFIACSPFWCTTYYDYFETCKKINEAIEAMKEDIINTVSWEKEQEQEAI